MAEEEEKAVEECKQEKCECAVGAPAWMVTYSDLVTLLLTFFVLLLSMASMDPVRFTEASSSLKDAFGMHNIPAHVDFAIPVLPATPKSKFTPIQQEMTVKMYEKVKSQLDKLKMSNDVAIIKKDSDTIILRINDNILFKPGQSKITPIAYPALRNISNIIRPLPMSLRIEGHTDNTKISNLDIDNWDLSMDRAVSVLRFYIQSDMLPLDRMSAIGYGQDRPISTNTTEEGRGQNRRVDFILRLSNAPDKKAPRGAPGQIPL